MQSTHIYQIQIGHPAVACTYIKLDNAICHKACVQISEILVSSAVLVLASYLP